jgi:pantetheine-phosphate adenylyltransferase
MKQKRTALFPGSFDPFTIGHESILTRAAYLFDEIIIGIGFNYEKKGFFSIEKRVEIIKKVCNNFDNVGVDTYSALTVQYCDKKNIHYIVRGLRTAADFEFERAVAQMNRKLKHDIETVFLLTEPDHTPVSSSVVREILRYGGNVDQFIPKSVNIKDYL